DIAQRDLYAFLRTCCRDATNRIGRALGNVRRAVNWIDSNVKFRRTGIPGAELFAFENPRRVILDSLADHHFTADVHQIEHAADSVAGCGVSRFLVAPSEPPQ